VRVALAGLLLLLAGVAQGVPAQVLLMEHAEITEGTSPPPPGDERDWMPVGLPHAWYADLPRTPRTLWYRIRFHLDRVPARPQRIFLERSSVHNMDVFLNGEQVWRHSDLAAKGVTIQPVLIPVPLRLLHAGENLIHLRVEGSGRAFHGVSHVRLGDSLELARMAGTRTFLQGQVIHIAAFAFGLAGLLSLALWTAHRRDAVLFWYGVSGTGLLAVTLAWQFTLWTPDMAPARSVLLFLRFSGFLTPLFILHLRLAGRRHPWLEGLLWLMLAGGCASIVPVHERSAQVWFWCGLVFSLLPLLFLLVLLMAKGVRRGAAFWFLVLADVAAVGFNLHDAAVRTGYLEFDRLFLTYYTVPFILLAAGAEVARRHLDGLRALRLTNVDLENRVNEKTREIEANHVRMREAERERAMLAERRRIMADMHDGLGSRLVGLLSLAQSGKSGPRELADGIAAALDELRLAVDSLEPVEGDVGVVLGNVRHRMRSVFERAGVRFNWNVGTLPRMDDLTPARVLAIQRILLEVFSNTIKHSAATEVTVEARRTPAAVQISIEDNGRGFDEAASGGGHGLANLRLRATQAGGEIMVETGAQRGTRVILTLPASGGSPPQAPEATVAASVPESGYLTNSGDLPSPAPRLA